MIIKSEIKKGINLSKIKTNKFKTTMVLFTITKKIDRKDVTFMSLLPKLLKSGSEKYKTKMDINRKLEELYGANIDFSVETKGNNQVINAVFCTINDEYKLDKNEDNLLKEGLDLLFEMIFNPLIEDNGFKEEYLNIEKENLKKIIEARINNKSRYAASLAVEKTFEGMFPSIRSIGYIEDLDNINRNNLYEFYKDLLANAKLDIFVSSNLDDSEVDEIVNNNEYIKQINERTPEYCKDREDYEISSEELYFEEKMNVVQGNLILLYLLNGNIDKNDKKVLLMNVILGVGANAKLFQNVREKASLAYTIASSYDYAGKFILIRAGIEINKFDKALKITKEQVEEMKKGNISQEEIDAAKELIVANLLGIDDDQYAELSYEKTNEILDLNTSREEEIEKVKAVTKEEIVEAANKMDLKTVLFLRN